MMTCKEKPLSRAIASNGKAMGGQKVYGISKETSPLNYRFIKAILSKAYADRHLVKEAIITFKPKGDHSTNSL